MKKINLLHILLFLSNCMILNSDEQNSKKNNLFDENDPIVNDIIEKYREQELRKIMQAPWNLSDYAYYFFQDSKESIDVLNTVDLSQISAPLFFDLNHSMANMQKRVSRPFKYCTYTSIELVYDGVTKDSLPIYFEEYKEMLQYMIDKNVNPHIQSMPYIRASEQHAVLDIENHAIKFLLFVYCSDICSANDSVVLNAIDYVLADVPENCQLEVYAYIAEHLWDPDMIDNGKIAYLTELFSYLSDEKIFQVISHEYTKSKGIMQKKFINHVMKNMTEDDLKKIQNQMVIDSLKSGFYYALKLSTIPVEYLFSSVKSLFSSGDVVINKAQDTINTINEIVKEKFSLSENEWLESRVDEFLNIYYKKNESRFVTTSTGAMRKLYDTQDEIDQAYEENLKTFIPKIIVMITNCSNDIVKKAFLECIKNSNAASDFELLLSQDNYSLDS